MPLPWIPNYSHTPGMHSLHVPPALLGDRRMFCTETPTAPDVTTSTSPTSQKISMPTFDTCHTDTCRFHRATVARVMTCCGGRTPTKCLQEVEQHKLSSCPSASIYHLSQRNGQTEPILREKHGLYNLTF